MTIREKSRMLCVLECIGHTVFIYPIMSIVWYMFTKQNIADLLLFCITGASAAGLYIIRRKIKKVGLYYLIILLFGALMFGASRFLGNQYIYAGIILVIFTIVMGAGSEYFDIERPSTFIAFMIFFVGVCTWLADIKSFNYIFYFCEAVYVVAFFIYENLKNADDFIWENRRTAFLHVGQIKNSNYLVTIIITTVLLLVGALSAFAFGPILNYLKTPILILIKKFMDKEYSFEFNHETNEEMQEYVRPSLEYGDSGSTAGINIVRVIIALLAILFIIFSIAYLVLIVKRIIEYLGDTRDGDIKEYVLPERKLDSEKVEREGSEEHANDKKAKSIRNIYKKTIKTSVKKDKESLGSSTPKEHKKMAGLDGDEAESFVEIYRKARYSSEECTDEDVLAMKNYKR